MINAHKSMLLDRWTPIHLSGNNFASTFRQTKWKTSARKICQLCRVCHVNVLPLAAFVRTYSSLISSSLNTCTIPRRDWRIVSNHTQRQIAQISKNKTNKKSTPISVNDKQRAKKNSSPPPEAFRVLFQLVHFSFIRECMKNATTIQ